MKLEELFIEGNVKQKKGNKNQSKGYLSPYINISKKFSQFFTHNTPINFLIWMANNKESIAATRFPVNIHHLSLGKFLPSVGEARAATNQPADRLISQSAIDDRVNWSTSSNLSEPIPIVNKIRAPDLNIGMILNIDGRMEKVASVKKVERSESNGWIEEEVPVEQIKPGDEILSLNEKTGKFEWHKVEAALFKGIQDLYELITSQGKRIRTTKEHPFYTTIIGNSNQDLRGSPLTNCKWLKVQSIKVGMYIATIDGWPEPSLTWEEISSIKKVKRQRVYDLQIANTHNFLANDIVAHNTLIGIGGNVGIGWTSPSQLFQINPTYMGTQLTNPLPFVVTSTGNVGVGTTAPRSALDILAGSLLQTPKNPAFVGGADIAAANNSVFISGKYAYMASAATNELQIYDVTNPNSPASIGSADLGGTGNSIHVSGKYAYVGKAGTAGTCNATTTTGCELLIYDVSNPASPLFIGGADNGGNAANSVFVSGKYVYLAKNANTETCSSTTNTGCELQIYDVSNPISPVYVGGADHGAVGLISVFVLGKFAYLGRDTAAGNDFQIYDVSNPTNPLSIGGADPVVQVNSVFVSGRYAYVGDNGGTLRIYDVSNPYSPSQASTATAGGAINSVFTSGRYTYLGTAANTGACNFLTATGCEIQVYDVGNPNNPLYMGGADSGGNAINEIFVSGRYIYTAKAVNGVTCSTTSNGGCELQVYDISGLDVTSAIIGSLEAGGLQVRENALINNQLYVGGGLGLGPGGLLSQGMVGIGVSSGTTGLYVEMLGARGTGSTAPSAIFNGGNVGIGSTEASTFPNLGSMLWIGGNVGIGWTNTGTATPSIPGLGLSVFGNVGIGTTSPAFRLQVIGNVGISSSLTVSNALVLSSYNCSGLTNGGKLTVNADGGVTCSPDAGAAAAVDGAGGTNQVAFWTDGDSLSGNNAFYWNNPLMRLGIGSSAPGNMLGVFGSVGIGVSFAGIPLPSNLANGLAVQGNVGIGTTSVGGALIVMGGNVGIGWTSPSQLFQINPTYMGTQLTNPLPFVVTSTGNVGVGTTAPRSALDILAGSLTQTPQNPTFIGGANIPGTAGDDSLNSVFVSGRYAYVVKISNGSTCSPSSSNGCELQIYDVSNPTSPTFVGGADNGGTATNYVFVSGRYAYMVTNNNTGSCSSSTNSDCELQIYDISNPSSPLFMGGLSTSTSLITVFVSGRYLYVGQGADGGTCNAITSTGCELQIYDISNPTTPVYIGGADDGGANLNSVFVSGRYAYLGRNSAAGNDFQIFDISNPANPLSIGGADPAVQINSVFVSGRYAYVGDNGGTFRIYDVSNPYSPSQVSTASAGDAINSVFTSGRYVYLGKVAATGACNFLTATGCEIQVYDVSNPNNPLYIGGTDSGGNAINEIFVSGRFIYAAKVVNTATCSTTSNGGCELQIYDISGLDVTSAMIHSLEAGGLQVRENAFVNNQLYVGGGLGVGPGGLMSQGMLGIGVSSGTTGLRVEMLGARGTGSTAPSAIFNGGNVGIGSTEASTFPTLSSMLWVAGNVGIGWTNTGTATPAMPGLGLSVFGNVGIGTTSPSFRLQVIGNVGISSSLTVSNTLVLSSYNCSGLTNGGKLTVNADGGVTCSPDAGAAAAVDGAGGTNQVAFWTDGDSLSGNNAFYWNNPLMRLGVGSSAPGSTLGVFGSVGVGVSFAGIPLPANLANGLAIQGNVGIGTTSVGGALIVMGGNVGIGWTSPAQLFQINATYMGTQLTNPLPFVVTSTGNVGVGTTAPRSALDILAGSLLQTPQNPTFIGGADTSNSGENVFAVFVSGRYAYVGKGGNSGTCATSDRTGCELQIYDVSNPNNPTFVGGATTGTDNTALINSIFVSGKYVYIAKNGAGGACNSSSATGCELLIYDIADAANPLFLGGANAGGSGTINAYTIFVSGRYAYVGKDSNAGTCSSIDNTGCELMIFDVSNPTTPVYIGGADNAVGGTARDINSVFVSGKYAYIGDLNTSGGTCSSTVNIGCEFQIYDVSNPANPLYIGGADPAVDVNSVYVSGRYAYVGDVDATLRIYDVSNPYSPTQVSTASAGGTDDINSVFVSGRYVYLGKIAATGACNFLTNTGCEIQVYDVSTPANPTFVGGADSGGDSVNEVFVSGRYIYTAKAVNAVTCSTTSNGGCELQVYDISGLDVTSAMIHSLEAGGLQVRENAFVNNQLYVGGGIGLGPGGLMSQGMVGIGVSSGTTGLYVEMLGVGTGYTAPAAIFNGGNVGINLGIGASTPGASLVVGGNVGIGWTGYTFAAMPGLGLSVFGSVGIGTTSPAYKLDVRGTVGIGNSLTLSQFNCSTYGNGGKLTTNSAGVVICDSDTTGGTSPDLDTVYDNDTDKILAVDSTSGLTFNLTTTGDFVVQRSGNATFQVLDSGPVLIGNQAVGASSPYFPRFADRTSAPTLSIDGEFAIGSVGTTATSGRIWVQSNGTTWRFNSTASAADYSEYIRQEDTSEPGDVMVLSEAASETVKRSDSAYDENIIGVITTRGTGNNIPEPYLSSATPVGPEYANVGMLGQVWVKVNLENGPIYIGDPLSSSSIQGQAMRSSKPGRIIGRAMEDYPEERSTTSSTGAPPYQILMQVNVTWWESEQFIERLDSGLLYLDGNLNIGSSATSKVGLDSFEVSLSVDGSILSSANILSLGNVGIGTTNPLYGLDVQKEASSSAAASIVNLSEADTPDTSALRLGLGTPVSGVSSNFIDFYAGVASDSAGVKVGRIRLNDNKVAYESVGADFAEYFDTLDEMEDGDLVSLSTVIASEAKQSSQDIDPTQIASSLTPRNDKVGKSSTPYDQNIIGVVSKDAAFVGNADYTSEVGFDSSEVDTPHRAIVGLLGQIKTKVSTINGEIKRGDYLTSSEIPGVAAKATRPGQVIGQALEEFTCHPEGTEGSLANASTPSNELRDSSPAEPVQNDSTCQGQIPVHVKPGFADPLDFLSSLSMDNEGNLIIPKLKVASLQLEQTNIDQFSTTSSSVIASDSEAISNIDQIASSTTSPRNDTVYYDLTGKIATLEDRIKELENVILSPQDEGSLANASTPSNELRDSSPAEPVQNDNESEATPSSSLATHDSSFMIHDSSFDLTPPDILLASDSATLTADLTVTSSAEILGTLTAYDAQIQNSLKSFGTTTLGDTLIAGNLTVDGTLSIENGNEINVIGYPSLQGDALESQIGILYLQKSPLAQGVDIFNGQITLEKDGTISAKTIIVDQIILSQNQSGGQALIPAGQIETLVENPFVEEDSIIFFTPVISDGTILTQTPAVVDKLKGQFTVKLARPEPQDLTFNYLVIGLATTGENTVVVTPAPLSQLTGGP